MAENHDANETPSEREVLERTHPQSKLLAELMRSNALRTGDLALAHREVTEVASSTLDIERASVWQLAPDRSRIECVDLFLRSRRAHESGIVLSAATYPAYFAALASARTISAHDAQRDPRTREFTESYLRPHAIGAMLDAPILVRGELVGILCHEHVGAPRTWQLWEELCAGTLADFVSLVLDASERAARERELSRYRDHLENLVATRTADLSKSEESLRHVLAACPIPLVLTRRADATVLFANRRTADVFEVPQEEVEGQRAPDYWVDPSARDALVAKVATEGRVEGFEAQLRSRSGKTFWAVISAQTMTFRGEAALVVGFYDISRQKHVEEQLLELAQKDALTDALNRRRFLELAELEIARSRRYARALSVAMIDIDHFKEVNDRHGHDAGDEVLRTLVRCCRENLRANDVLARWGGEEFVVLLPETDAALARRIAERLRQTVADHVTSTAKEPIRVTVSLGIAEARAEGESLAELLKRADVALYSAKERGRNRVEQA